MSAFHPFPRLPYELRSQIWRLAVHPRFVHVHTRRHGPCSWDEVAYVSTPTVSPPVMQVCRESRQHGRYRQAFTIGSEPRYLWVNFESDMICVPDDKLAELELHQQDIQRLRLISDGSEKSYDDFWHHGCPELADFPMLREIHVVIPGNPLIWASTFEDRKWGSCPKDNIRFIGQSNGLILNGHQLLMAMDWGMFHALDAGGKVQDLDNLVEEIELALDDSHLTLSELREIE